MSEILCMLCKDLVNIVKFNIDQDFTKYSTLSLRVVLESVFEQKIILGADLYVCTKCRDLLNDLDLAESSYKNLRQKVLGYLDYNSYTASKSNAYCQTDVFIENVLEYDVHGKNKGIEETVTDEQDDENENLSDKSAFKKFECHVCFKKFITKNGLSTHIKRLHGNLISKTNEDFVQDQDETFLFRDTLIHPDTTNNEENMGEQNVVNFNSDNNCDENTDDFNIDNKDEVNKSQKGSRGRKKKHPGVLKPYKCTSCPKTWKTLGELKNHLSAHSNIRPFVCEICGQAYKHKTALDVHVGMHNGIYPFRCTYCKKSFTQKGALQRHMPIHTGETPYQCDLCGKRFVHHTSFNIHQLSHSGQKDYKCAQCGLALLSGSHLKRHMRVHTGERNYACNLCDKRFAERYNLVSHQKLHEKSSSNAAFKRNHRCQICGTAYNRRLKLDEHMTRDHQKLIETDVPYIQQLFIKSDNGWPSSYDNLKVESAPEPTY